MTPPFEIRFDDEVVLNRLFGEELHLVELSGPFTDLFAVRAPSKPSLTVAGHMTTTLIRMVTAKECPGALGWRRGFSDEGYDLAVVGLKA
jgi:hypothetical protein